MIRAVRDMREQVTPGDRERLSQFPRRISRAARARGFRTVFELARAAHVSEEAMRKYRSGDRLPTAPVLLRLAEALNVPVDWLLGLEAPETARRLLAARDIAPCGGSMASRQIEETKKDASKT